jgi:hypothetical protein
MMPWKRLEFDIEKTQDVVEQFDVDELPTLLLCDTDDTLLCETADLLVDKPFNEWRGNSSD